MKFIVRLVIPLATTLILFGFASPGSAPAAADRADFVLFRLAGNATERAIQGSKWGAIGILQQSINAQAAACGVSPVPQDGFLGRTTVDAVQAIATCRGTLVAEPDAITTTAFLAVTGAEPPTALARARMLSQTMEGTDYDALEWNVCADWRGDAGSVLTWGPNGKTLGWGGELLQVLQGADRARLQAAFDAEGARGLERLLSLPSRPLTAQNRHRYPAGRALIAEVCNTPGQKAAWTRAFARLGADPAIRAAYDAQAWGEAAWFRSVVDRLSTSWRAQGLEPTEVDFAFFIDRAIHMGWGAPRFEAVDKALAAASPLTNAEARFVVADAVRPTARPEDRLARDAIFLIDAEQELAPLMANSRSWPRGWKAAWRARANISAADVGLSDARLAPPWEDPPTPKATIERTGPNAPGPGGASQGSTKDLLFDR